MAERFTTRLAVFVILRNKRGEVLLQQRAGNRYLSGYWDFPSGHVEYGESVREAASRELLEEAGIHASAEDLKLTHIDQYFIERDYVNFVFAINTWEGQPIIGEPEKCSAIAYFPPDALPEKCVNVVRVVQQAGFSEELTYSVTNRASYEATMDEPFTEKP